MFLMMTTDLHRINVQKIASLELFNSPINEVSFELNLISKLKKYLQF